MKSISKIAGILFLGLTTSACSDNSKTTVAQFKETKAECTPSAIPNAFIVHWKDGTTTVIRGQTREDFERNVFEPNKKFIAFAEQDHSIALSPLSLSPSYSP
ncbi:MAG: hypothetical protein RBT63_05515, partial [Bdellovibrionales bacterium]|nr:hypothetical protein [Bdellovibrionales bacterium]